MKTNLKLKNLFFAVVFVISATMPRQSQAHCEVPCGIFADSIRVALIYEHITTIEKAMNQINELSKADEINYNQLVRWINTKEDHAKKIQHEVSQYFLHQRIKLVDKENKEAYDKYLMHLTLLHEMMVYAMKTKQSTDLQYIEKLRETLAAFEDAYFHTHDH